MGTVRTCMGQGGKWCGFRIEESKNAYAFEGLGGHRREDCLACSNSTTSACPLSASNESGGRPM